MIIIKAINFAGEKHREQIRKGTKLPYILHPIIVSNLLVKYKVSKKIKQLQAAAILHDTLEDTEAYYEELKREFGVLVADIVMELTSDEELIEKIGKNEYLKEKMLNISKYAFIIKLVDRLSNVMDHPTDKYLVDTLELMEHLRENREDMSKSQLKVISKIEKVCMRTQKKRLKKSAK